MNDKIPINKIGEVGLIEIIEGLVIEKTGNELLRDDSSFYDFKNLKSENCVILNTDMFVSSTDAPKQMTYYQMGRKSVLMNLSDLIVKGINPQGIVISLGLPPNLKLLDFKELINGILDYCVKWDLNYIGGDLNKTHDIIINPTVFGIGTRSNIIYREGIEVGDYLVANGKFGLTGVGFNILLKRKSSLDDFPSFKRSILSVLEPEDLGREGLILAENKLATASIDSSDGLAKCLTELMISNSNIGFEIELNKELIDDESLKYSQECNIPIEGLVFDGGEEFIHLFTINPNNFNDTKKLVEAQGGQLFKIGQTISEEKIYIKKAGKRTELKNRGYEHFK